MGRSILDEPRSAAGSAEPSPPPRHGALLREVLLRRPGWVALPGDAEQVVIGRGRYRLTPLAAGEGWTVRLVERPGHASMPAYLARRELHRRGADAAAGVLTVFTDAAGTRQVWAWSREMPYGPVAYTEEHRAGEVPGDSATLDLPGKERCAPVDPAIAEGAAAARESFLSRLRRAGVVPSRDRGPVLSSYAQRLQDLVERSGKPEVARGVWRALNDFRVLDPGCGTGSWLLGCLEALTAIGVACLQRMQAWTADHPGPRSRARSRRYPDFHSLLLRARELGGSGRLDRLVLETVALRCLHGAERDPQRAAQCRGRIAGRIAATLAGEPASRALVDVRVGTVAAGLTSPGKPAGLAHRDPALAAVMEALRAEAEALVRAEGLLIRTRLRLGGSLEELYEGREEIRRRRETLSRRWGGDRAATGASLYPWLEYGGDLRAGGFDLVRCDALPRSRGRTGDAAEG